MNRSKKTFEQKDLTSQEPLSAGCFSSWLRHTRIGLLKNHEATVPCNDCNVCCRSSYFIHIKPEETEAIGYIHKKLLFPAPGLPKGNLLLGYDQDGRCPMLVENQCSIYENRPQTCRSYDCRIFTAAGIAADEADKVLINQQIKRWRFSYPTPRDLRQHLAVQAAANFLKDHPDCFPAGFIPRNSTQLAILAIKVYDVFLKTDPNHGKAQTSDEELTQAVLKSYEEFSNLTQSYHRVT